MNTNFQEMIEELVSAEHSTALIAHKAQCSESYIKQLSQGKRKTPGYDIGVRIATLHKEVCGDAVDPQSAG